MQEGRNSRFRNFYLKLSFNPSTIDEKLNKYRAFEVAG
jgi:hypothetical protein